jgi:heme-degrading monooxygenase HmoA
VYARATTLRASPEHAEEAIVHYQDGIPSFREIAGNRGAFLLVDRSAGKAISVTLWESEEAMRRADELRQQTQESGGEVDEYEVAVWAVS